MQAVMDAVEVEVVTLWAANQSVSTSPRSWFSLDGQFTYVVVVVVVVELKAMGEVVSKSPGDGVA